MSSSPCAVIKMVGIGQRSAFNLAWRSSPDIPGMRISVIRHPVSCCWPDLKKSSAEANDCTEKPSDFSKRCTATRYDSSSSITATIFSFLSLAMQIKDRSVLRKTQLWVVIMPLICMYKGGRNSGGEGGLAGCD